MSDTHPNAYRQLAEEKRQLAAQYANEANLLETQAQEAEDALAAANDPTRGIPEAEIVDVSDEQPTKKSRFSK